jgi:hypothetical protein
MWVDLPCQGLLTMRRSLQMAPIAKSRKDAYAVQGVDSPAPSQPTGPRYGPALQAGSAWASTEPFRNQPRKSLSSSTSFGLGRAPTMRLTTAPPSNASSVGMLITS